MIQRAWNRAAQRGGPETASHSDPMWIIGSCDLSRYYLNESQAVSIAFLPQSLKMYQLDNAYNTHHPGVIVVSTQTLRCKYQLFSKWAFGMHCILSFLPASKSGVDTAVMGCSLQSFVLLEDRNGWSNPVQGKVKKVKTFWVFRM